MDLALRNEVIASGGDESICILLAWLKSLLRTQVQAQRPRGLKRWCSHALGPPNGGGTGEGISVQSLAFQVLVNEWIG